PDSVCRQLQPQSGGGCAIAGAASAVAGAVRNRFAICDPEHGFGARGKEEADYSATLECGSEKPAARLRSGPKKRETQRMDLEQASPMVADQVRSPAARKVSLTSDSIDAEPRQSASSSTHNRVKAL